MPNVRVFPYIYFTVPTLTEHCVERVSEHANFSHLSIMISFITNDSLADLVSAQLLLLGDIFCIHWIPFICNWLEMNCLKLAVNDQHV